MMSIYLLILSVLVKVGNLFMISKAGIPSITSLVTNL